MNPRSPDLCASCGSVNLVGAGCPTCGSPLDARPMPAPPMHISFREDRPTHVSAQTAEDVVRALDGRLPAAVVAAHLAELPFSYIARTPAGVIGDHILLVERSGGRTAVEHTRRGDADEITLVASDRPGILSALAGTLALHRVSILGGAIHTKASGYAIDALSVSRAAEASFRWDVVCSDIAKALDGQLTVDDASVLGPGGGSVAVARRTPTIVYVDNGSSHRFTKVEVNAEDRIGVLYVIAREMAKLQLDIHLAQVETLGATTVDTFFLRRADGSRIESVEDIQTLRRAITTGIAALP